MCMVSEVEEKNPKSQVSKNSIEDRIKAFYESFNKTVKKSLSPSPYININPTGEVEFLNGKAPLKDTGVTLTTLDFMLLSAVHNIPLLLEGTTGSGKSYTSKAFLDHVFDGRYYSLRLSGGVIGSSIFEPYKKTVVENGFPKVELDETKVDFYGGAFLDEINRANDTNEALAMLDGEVFVNDKNASLGFRTEGKYKKIVCISAINPSKEYIGTQDLDEAIKNRFLIIRMPDDTSEVGSNQIHSKRKTKKLWDLYREKTKDNSSLEELVVEILNPLEETSLNRGGEEFLDLILSIINPNFEEGYERNLKIIGSHNFELERNTEYDSFLSKVKSFNPSFTRRDIEKVYSLSQGISYIRSLKTNQPFRNASIEDVVSATMILLQNRNEDLNPIIQGLKKEYSELKRTFSEGDENLLEAYNIFGVRYSTFMIGLAHGIKNGFESYKNYLENTIENFNVEEKGVLKPLIVSRLLSDIYVLLRFSDENKGNLFLTDNIEDERIAFLELYSNTSNVLYEHRLSFIKNGGDNNS